MAAVVKSTKAGYDAISAMRCIVISELFSSGAFEKFDPVYIDSDGKVAAAIDDTTGIKFDGFAMNESDSDMLGTPVTIMGQGLIMEWLEDSDAYTPGTLLYVGDANELETTGTTPVAMTITDREIIVIAPPGLR